MVLAIHSPLYDPHLCSLLRPGILHSALGDTRLQRSCIQRPFPFDESRTSSPSAPSLVWFWLALSVRAQLSLNACLSPNEVMETWPCPTSWAVRCWIYLLFMIPNIVPLMWYICICLGLPWLIHILVTKENLPIYASFSLLRVVLLLALCIIIFTVLTLGACLLFRQHQCRLTKYILFIPSVMQYRTKGWVLVTCYFVFFFSYLFYMIEYILW